MRIPVVLLLVIAVSYACGSSTAPKPAVLKSVKVLSGAAQQGPINAALASAIVVQALDSSGKPMPGLGVAFGPSDGSLNPASANTDSTGKVSAIWTLGSRVGPDTLFVAVTQSGSGQVPIATVIDTVYATANP